GGLPVRSEPPARKNVDRMLLNFLKNPNRAASLLAGLLAAGHCQAQPTNGALPGTLCVMTYNIHFASFIPPHPWTERRLPMRELIQKISPDIMGTQEGHFSQLADLASGLPDYDWIGNGCEDGQLKGKYTAIFYRRARLEPTSTNTFWLSDMPRVA